MHLAISRLMILHQRSNTNQANKEAREQIVLWPFFCCTNSLRLDNDCKSYFSSHKQGGAREENETMRCRAIHNVFGA